MSIAGGAGGTKLPRKSAALAGVPAGIQATGPWAGRRQLYVKFAGEAETATIYSADALRGELQRLTARSKYHAVAIAGRDPLAEEEFLSAALEGGGAGLPVMLEHDGQRPDALKSLLGVFALVQVTLDGSEGEAALERVAASLGLAAGAGVAHALVIIPGEGTSDPRLLRIVESVHAASAKTMVVLHPSVESASDRDRRWVAWMERATAVHDDVRILPRLPAPTGMR
jgi:hypothetical protein